MKILNEERIEILELYVCGGLSQFHWHTCFAYFILNWKNNSFVKGVENASAEAKYKNNNMYPDSFSPLDKTYT